MERTAAGLGLDFCAQGFEKIAQERMKSRPSGTGNQIPVDRGLVHREFHIRTAGESNVGSTGGVGVAFFAFEDAGCGENLRAVANGGERFA